MGRLKEVRTEKKLTQQQVADLFGISLRSYKSYENDPVKEGSLKYHYMLVHAWVTDLVLRRMM